MSATGYDYDELLRRQQQAPQPPMIAPPPPLAGRDGYALPGVQVPMREAPKQVQQIPQRVQSERPAEMQPPPAPQIAAPSIPQTPQHVIPIAPRGTIEGDKSELSRKIDTGSGISQIHSKIEDSDWGQRHPILSKIAGWGAEIPARLGDMALSTVAPAIAVNTPGTEYHHRMLVNQDTHQLANEEANAGKEATTAATRAEVPLREAQTEAAQPIEITDEIAKAIGNPALAGEKISQKVLGQLVANSRTNDTRETNTNATNESRETIAGNKNESTSANVAATNASREGIA